MELQDADTGSVPADQFTPPSEEIAIEALFGDKATKAPAPKAIQFLAKDEGSVTVETPLLKSATE